METSHLPASDEAGFDMNDLSYLPSFSLPTKVLDDRDSQRWKNPTTPSNGLPNSNRDNIMDALRNLQNKICNLELERQNAQDSVRIISSKTAARRGSPSEEQKKRTAADERMSKQALDLQAQLSSAEQRCRQLDEQLDSMRRLVRDAEAERRMAAERDGRLARAHAAARMASAATAAASTRGQSSELLALRREHEQLSTVQAQAESKIRALEEQLNEERHHRRALQERAAEISSQAEANRILLQAFSPTRAKPPPSALRQEADHVPEVKSCKKTDDKPKATASSHRHADAACSGAAEHYRLNLAHIPFVVGQATTASHSLGANVQRVIAMLKYHNPRLCAAAAVAALDAKGRCRQRSASADALSGRRPSTAGSAGSRDSHSSSSSTHATEEEGERRCLGDILEKLQVEFSHLTLEHQDLMRRLSDVLSEQQATQMRADLVSVVSKMEAKGDQIANLVRYLESKLDTAPQAKSRKSGKRNSIARREQSIAATGHAAPKVSPAVVASRVKTRDDSSTGIVEAVGPRPCCSRRSGGQTRHSPSRRRETLCALRDIKTLQGQLKPADLAWA